MTNVLPRILWKNLVEFFKVPSNFETFYVIKQGQARNHDGKKVSLRVIEYFLTNFVMTKCRVTYILARKNDRVKILDENDPEFEKKRDELLENEYTLSLFNVRKDYEDKISNVYHKRLFDCCNRGSKKDKFIFRGANDLQIETTLRQLVFFRWAIQNGVCEWIFQNAGRIINAMKADNVEKKRAREENPDIKSREITLRLKNQNMKPINSKRSRTIIDNSVTSLYID